MTRLADLHTHSTASDGQYTPTELVRLAKERSLDVLALTDHDTVDGLEEAVQAGKQAGIQVIRGIELSAREYPTFHILGYGFDPEAPALSDLCRELKEGRDQRAPRIVAFLEEQGVHIPLSEVEELAGGRIVGRPHFAQVLVRHGYVSSNREAFDRYLDTYQIGVDSGKLECIVRELTGFGLDAIECFYPRHTPEQQSFYLHLAEKYGLHVTGGSDFHGERVKPDIKLAGLGLELGWL